jgi:DNA replication protein DnaC
MNRPLIYELATARFIAQREDALLLGPPGTGKSHLAQAIGHAAIQQGLLTSNRPVDDWGKLLGDTAAITALLDRLLHHAHVLKCGPRSWRTKVQADLRPEERTQ